MQVNKDGGFGNSTVVAFSQGIFQSVAKMWGSWRHIPKFENSST